MLLNDKLKQVEQTVNDFYEVNPDLNDTTFGFIVAEHSTPKKYYITIKACYTGHIFMVIDKYPLTLTEIKTLLHEAYPPYPSHYTMPTK